MRRIGAYVALLVVALLAGCATAPYMPLSDEKSKVEPGKPLFLMSVVVKNEYRDRWQPRVLNIVLVKEDGTGQAQTTVFRMDNKGTLAAKSDGERSVFLVRFTADSPSTGVRGMNAMGSAFPIHGFYFIPIHASLPKVESGVVYLGAVKATIRERKENEFRAGPVIPLIDQAVAGASGGTFDIEISDAFDADLELFRSAFPALKEMQVGKSILPPWDRAKAQAFWEKS